MTGRRERVPAELELGRSELPRGRWEPARTGFGRALADDETPEALEGLSWAAWWLDDAETVFAARERAYRALPPPRRRGRRRAHGDLARRSTSSTSTAPWRVASGWLARAHRLLDPLGRARARLARLPRGLPRTRRRRHRGRPRARARPRRDRAGAAGSPTSRCSGSRSKGRRSWRCAQVPPGCAASTRRPRRRSRATRRSRSPARGRSAFSSRRAPTCSTIERAFDWCDRIAEFAERYGSRYMLGVLPRRVRRGGALARALGGGRGAARGLDRGLHALAPGVGRRRPLAGSRSCAAARAAPTRRWALLDGAGAAPSAQLCRARLALDRGEAREAAELLERLLRQLPRRRALDRRPALELLVHARAARGALDAAAAALDELRESGLAGTPPLGACADLAEGALAAAAGDHARARALLEDAVDGFERSGAPYEAALARVALATSLRALGRAEAAAQEARAARERLLELGAAAGRAARARSAARRPRRDADRARARGAAAARRGAHEPPDRRAPGVERAHRAPPRDQHPAQAGAAVARGGGGARGRARGCSIARSGHGDRAQDGKSAKPRAACAYRRRMSHASSPLSEAAALARIDELAAKAEDNSPWGLGDYHRFALETVWDVGPVARRGLRRRARPARARRGRRHRATSPSAPPRRAPTSSPAT